MATEHDYLAQLLALAPQGAAWAKESEASLARLFGGLATELARIDGRASTLLEQIDPRTVTEMLPDWERAFGLPDGCVLADPTEGGRRMAVHQRVAALGGQSQPYFVSMAALLGYDAEVEESRPSRVAFSVPQVIRGRPWAFAWRVAVYGPVLDGLTDYASADLECVVTRSRPAHTLVSFDYDPEPITLLHFDFLNPPD